jgi:hypothetical protein
MALGEFDIALIIAGSFVVVACLITFNSIRLHFKHSKQLQIRNFTIRILLMIPVYGIEAWFAIYSSRQAVMFKVLREGYEAFVILSFMQLMLTYLGGPVSLARDLASKGNITPHLPPLCRLKPWVGAQFVWLTLMGTLQYVPASIFVMALSLSTWFAGSYKEGEVSYDTSWIYCAVITNCSQMWALYCLVLFYQATKDELKPINPLPKFMCVKLIIFFTWWQGIVIDISTHYKWVRLSSDPETETRAESNLQNFIICLEMLFLAVCHSYAFPSQEFTFAHNPRSRAAALADKWETTTDKPQGTVSLSSDGRTSQDELLSMHGDSSSSSSSRCRSPRGSLPVRMAKSVGRSINHRVERLQRLGSGVMATTGDVMSGVNILDIWKVLRQAQKLDAMATEAAEAASAGCDVYAGDLKRLEEGSSSSNSNSNFALGKCTGSVALESAAAQPGILMKSSPLHVVLLSQSQQRRQSWNQSQNQSQVESTAPAVDRGGSCPSPSPANKASRPSAEAGSAPTTKRELAEAWDLDLA